MAIKSLYVGNLPYSTTDENLVELFGPFGGSNARIIEGRGFAFVDVDADQMDAAIEAINGKPYNGRTLTVNEARPREPRAPGGGAAHTGDPARKGPLRLPGRGARALCAADRLGAA